MYPILAHWGQVTFYTYGFVMMSALFLIYYLVSKNLDESLMHHGHLGDISFLIVFSIWFGGGLVSLALTGEFTLASLRENFNYQKLQQVGTMAISSSFFLTLLGYCTWKRLPFIKLLDFFMPYFVLGYALQRTFGCFSAGCCYGLPTDVSWGVEFGNTLNIGPPAGIQVHPTQLYMGLAAFISFMILTRMRHRFRSVTGAMTGFGIMSLFGVYFLVSFYRGDLKETSIYWGYDVNQIFSLGLFFTGGLIWLGSVLWKAQMTKK